MIFLEIYLALHVFSGLLAFGMGDDIECNAGGLIICLIAGPIILGAVIHDLFEK